jgi:hypothetical protein
MVEAPKQWEAWVPLAVAVASRQLPHRPGLYRIRRVRGWGLDYLGQTGMGTMTLRKRVSMLRGVEQQSAR